MRQPFYPDNRIDLMERFMVDALKAGERAPEGHRVVDRYEMEKRLPLIRCPTLVIAPTADPHAYPHAGRVAAAIAGSMVIEIANGMVPLPDQLPGDRPSLSRRSAALGHPRLSNPALTRRHSIGPGVALTEPLRGS